ncbi:hypothetical protein [Vaccinia virus]|uniref:Ankyrin like-protein n=1 Tax=Vaccinia virus TaxID=10245 RepID=A0A0A7A5Z7_VACCV|nr:hypothetical protein [Vaccinia virus]AHB35847.1 hypothetical protein [Vaccinia virus]ALF36163.1 hypothetical protein VACV_CTGV_CM01_005 [Vaccinia virus]ALF36369.1 ankyrin like-protein [Vaccinia virus]QQA05053.1 ankyrin like-protein [Vaccinia virus]
MLSHYTFYHLMRNDCLHHFYPMESVKTTNTNAIICVVYRVLREHTLPDYAIAKLTHNVRRVVRVPSHLAIIIYPLV